MEIRTVQKVDDTMAAINEQRELANEIADTISQPFGMPFEDVRAKRFLTSTVGSMTLCYRARSNKNWKNWNKRHLMNDSRKRTMFQYTSHQGHRRRLLVRALHVCGRTADIVL